MVGPFRDLALLVLVLAFSSLDAKRQIFDAGPHALPPVEPQHLQRLLWNDGQGSVGTTRGGIQSRNGDNHPSKVSPRAGYTTEHSLPISNPHVINYPYAEWNHFKNNVPLGFDGQFYPMMELDHCRRLGVNKLWRLPLAWMSSNNGSTGCYLIAHQLDFDNGNIIWDSVRNTWSALKPRLFAQFEQNVGMTLHDMIEEEGQPDKTKTWGISYKHSPNVLADIDFLDSRDEPAATEEYKQSARAFEQVLGNALSTYEPVTEFVRDFALALVDHVNEAHGAVQISPAWHVLLRNYPGTCYPGRTTDFLANCTLQDVKNWISTSNYRVILSKVYKLVEGAPSEPWMHSMDKRTKGYYRVEDRFNDPLGYYPRFRMPLAANGFGWVDLTKITLPTRKSVLRTKLVSLARDRDGIFRTVSRSTIAVPLSEDEEEPLEVCQQEFDYKFGKVNNETLPFDSGKFHFHIPPEIPFAKLGAKTGLPLTAGASATTANFMGVAEILYRDDLEKSAIMRLAMLAWMLPYQDHTLLEIVAGASRSFPGRSYPSFCGNGIVGPALCSRETAQEWRQIFKQLLPSEAGQAKMNAHIENYMADLSERLNIRIQWPDEFAVGSKWWDHAHFDFVNQDLQKFMDDDQGEEGAHIMDDGMWAAGIMSDYSKCPGV